MTTEQTWLDVMPVIPLDGYEGPAIDGDGNHCTVVQTGPGWVDVVYRRECSPDGSIRDKRWATGDVHPACDDPQGFGYALARWMNGQTTDADRLALALALADVVGHRDSGA